MSHDRDLRDQDVEELAEELWTLGEEGRSTLDDLRASTAVAALDATLDSMGRRGLAAMQGGRVALSPAGRQLAERQVRRHRLAEVLFITVFEAPDESAANRTACVMEHVLGPGLTDSICAFLGHPKVCPHGKPIPPGECCRSFTRTVEPLVQPLDRLPVGRTGRIVHVVTREPGRLVRLGNLGLAPGVEVQLAQIAPTTILRLGETTLAVEPEVAAEIYVSPVG